MQHESIEVRVKHRESDRQRVGHARATQELFPNGSGMTLRFLRALIPPSMTGFVEFRYGPEADCKRAALDDSVFVPVARLEDEWSECWSLLLDLNLKGACVCYGVRPRLRKGGKGEDCGDTTDVLWLDMDHPRELPANVARPSAAVASGRPGHRHLFWFLRRAIPWADAQALMKALAKLCDADNSYGDSQVLRLPGLRNHKPEAGGAFCRVIELRDDRYEPGDIILPIVSGEKVKEGGRSVCDWALVVQLARHRVDAAVIRQVLTLREKPQEELRRGNGQYVDRTMKRALAGAAAQSTQPANMAAADRYEATPAGLFHLRRVKDGAVRVQLTNFTAKITRDLAQDDGAEVQRAFEVEALLNGRPCHFAVPAAQFAGMGWVSERMGAGAIVLPGMGTKDHARAAIQLLSAAVREDRIYSHTGWRKIDDAWVYLHAGGGIGSGGRRPGVDVALPSNLGGFELPDPPSSDELPRALRVSVGTIIDGALGTLVDVFPVSVSARV